MESIDQQEVRIEIEDGPKIYVGEAAIEVIRAECNGKADKWLAEAMEAWGDCDVADLEEIKDVQFKLAMARDMIATLVQLAPVPEDR